MGMAQAALVAFMVVGSLVGLGAAGAQDDAQATISALQTRLAEVEGSTATATAELGTGQPVPEGIPEGAQEAEIAGHIDGDKILVSVGGENEEVRLLGIDAPELDEGEYGECYASESSERLARMLPEGRTVYLESDGEDKDGKGRLLRFVWFVNRSGTAALANELMLGAGLAGLDEDHPYSKHVDELVEAVEEAQQENAGLWGACGEVHAEVTPTPQAGDADRPAQIGDTVTKDGLAVTITDAFFSDEYGFSTPKGGYDFLVIEVTVENVGDEDMGYYDDQFAAIDYDTGAEFDDTFVLAENPLGSGELSPGEYVTGVVVPEVQETARRVRVKYATSIFGGENLYWLVER